MALLQLDHKTKLSRFCQKYCRRAIGKTDVVYTTEKCSGTGMHISTVKLGCIDDGPEFAGEYSNSKKEAEHSAAAQALEAYAEEVERVSSQARGRKRPPPPPDMEVAPPEAPEVRRQRMMQVHEAISRASYKSLFIEFCTKVLKRAMTKTDFTFKTECEDPDAAIPMKSYICTLSCPSLPDPFTQEEWKGEACGSTKEAEHSAALVALNAMKDHDEVNPIFKEAGVKINEKLQAMAAAAAAQAVLSDAAYAAAGEHGQEQVLDALE
eukprot:TRINITY_DN8564_c0_g2_i1.p1 TRINITY_DN8564_c0_g2~~TRINITY_DN8564_c0_g2_i1.p1  ORF type:complete len:266 (-),score=84.43 TRINITY_DN8564_c0_g2_i1:245-1042(-)